MFIQGMPPKLNSGNAPKSASAKSANTAGGLGLFQSIMKKNSDQQSHSGDDNHHHGNQQGTEAIASAENTSDIQAPQAIFGMIGIQQANNVGDDFLNKQKREEAARKWGSQVLDKLDEIKKIIVNGNIPADKLQELALQAGSNKVLATDPLLRDILQDIQTRALVEIAKLRKAEKIIANQNNFIA